jgi:hypothetical protein
MDGERSARRFVIWGAICALAAVAAYWRALSLPLISDDYLVIWLARGYGEPGGWSNLWGDALYRCRATFMILTHFMDRWFGVADLPYNLASLLLHIANCLLILALASWDRIGWRLAIPAAIFFAMRQGHQEAVIWYSAMPDQLVLLFGLAAVQALLRDRLALVWLFYLLALASKESAVSLTGFFALIWFARGTPWKTVALRTAPFAAAAVVYFAASYLDRSTHLHYNDGTFSLSAPFPWIAARSMSRALWVAGWVALAALAWRRSRELWIAAAFGLIWMAIALLPYSFLMYMPFVPSRHTYIAGVGVSLIAAAGFVALRERTRPPVAVAAAAAILLGNAAYLWTRKHEQFVERARPTEVVVDAVRDRRGTVEVECFPYPTHVADMAIELHYGEKRDVRYTCGEKREFRVRTN